MTGSGCNIATPAPRRLPGARRGRRSRGFTLLELLVATAIVVVLVGSLFMSIRIAFKQRESIQNSFEPLRTSELAMEMVKADIETAMPPTGTLAGEFSGQAGTDDRGHSASTLEFISTGDGPRHDSGDGDLRKILFQVITPDGGTDHVLVRTVTSNLLPTQTVTPDDEIICRGVSSFTLEFYDGTQWLPSWDSVQENNALPAAVRVTLELDRSGFRGTQRVLTYTRIFQIACSTAASDSANTGFSGL